MMSSLTVEVGDTGVQFWFTRGYPRKSLLFSEIQSIQQVRHGWRWGVWHGRGVTLYSVSGLDAVELQMKNGARYRIGTAEPTQLAEAIRARLDA